MLAFNKLHIATPPHRPPPLSPPPSSIKPNISIDLRRSIDRSNDTAAAMDSEPEELQFLGVFGVYREAYKLVLSWRRIFSQIIAAFVLPLSAVYLTHVAISAVLFTSITRNEEALEDSSSAAAQSRLQSLLASEWTAVILFKAAYLLFVLVFSLFSTSAVVYTVACAYTAKDVTFSKVLSVVPKVWKRLMVTFIWNLLIVFAYNTLAAIVIIAALLVFGTGAAGEAALAVLLLAYASGLVYIGVVWHVASVVSVLEDHCGLSAMRKSRELLRGKVWLAVAVFLMLNASFVGLEVGFRLLVVENASEAPAAVRAGYGAAVLSMLAAVVVLGLVVQAVVYLVCKSYHHESIDKSSLADHLEVYLGEYVPLRAKDVQLEQFHV